MLGEHGAVLCQPGDVPSGSA